MADLYEVVKTEIESLIAAVKDDIADKQLTLGEIWELSQHAVSSFIKIADSLDGTRAEKKVIVMKAAEYLYDEVIAPIDIKKIPNVFEPTFDRLGKGLFMELIGGVVDFLIKFTKD
jgi:hypothetical protein